MDELKFLTAGMPLRTDKKRGYENALEILDEMNKANQALSYANDELKLENSNIKKENEKLQNEI